MSASLAPECNEVKERYDTCFLKWYSEEYIRGNSTVDKCESLFKDYRACLKKGLKERGLDSMLSEVKDSKWEDDLKHLKRN